MWRAGMQEAAMVPCRSGTGCGPQPPSGGWRSRAEHGAAGRSHARYPGRRHIRPQDAGGLVLLGPLSSLPTLSSSFGQEGPKGVSGLGEPGQDGHLP